MITCSKCSWKWHIEDSDESDLYVCHKCGFDNTLFYQNVNEIIKLIYTNDKKL